MERLTASPGTLALMMPLVPGLGLDVRAVLPTVRVPTLVVQHADDPLIPPEWGKDVADRISGAKYVELPGRNQYHFVEPWRESFQEIATFLTGSQAEVKDDRVLATVLFTDIADSTRRAAPKGRPCQCRPAFEGSTHPGGHDDRRMARALAPYRRDHPYCEWPGCIRLMDQVDHMVPLAELPGGDSRRYDPANFQSLCRAHHSTKTRADSQRGKTKRDSLMATPRTNSFSGAWSVSR